MDEPEEEWKPVPGYEGIYMVSNFGNVISVSLRKNSQPFKPLKLSLCNSGYYKVTLRKNGESSNVMVHRIVAIAFIPNPKHKDQVNHKDGDKLNNMVDNLEWVTRSENQLHASRVLGKKHRGSEHSVKINSGIARQIYEESGTNVSLASKYGISDAMVGRIKRGEAWRSVTCQSTE